MVAIARAMMLSPAILLLDEPFEGLAPVVVTRLIEAVKRIKALLKNGHHAEALVTSVFTFEKMMRKTSATTHVPTAK